MYLFLNRLLQNKAAARNSRPVDLKVESTVPRPTVS